MAPSQLSSMPLHTSVNGFCALQPCQTPLAAQVSMPLHVPAPVVLWHACWAPTLLVPQTHVAQSVDCTSQPPLGPMT